LKFKHFDTFATMNHTYVEIIDIESEQVEYRIEVTGKASREIDAIIDGLIPNLNSALVPMVIEYDKPQPQIP